MCDKMAYKCKSCKRIMSSYRMPQICDGCLEKGGSGSDPDYDSQAVHEYGGFYVRFDDDECW